MSRPPWGKVAGECLTEGGNSLSILDCSTTNAPIPTPTTQTKPHYTCKAIQYRKRAPPLRALTGPPLPKGRGSYNSNTFYIKQHSTKDPKAFPLGNNKHKQNLHIRNSLSLGGEMSQRDREGRLALNPRLPSNLATYPSDCKAGAQKKPSPLGEGGADRRRKGGTRFHK